MQRCVVHLPRAATNPILPEHESCTGPSRLPGALQFRATQRDFGLNQGLIVEAEAAPPVRRGLPLGRWPQQLRGECPEMAGDIEASRALLQWFRV